MGTELIKEQDEEKIRLTNIVGETKKEILDKPRDSKTKDSEEISDDEVQMAIERLNPDPNSMKNWG